MKINEPPGILFWCNLLLPPPPGLLRAVAERGSGSEFLLPSLPACPRSPAPHSFSSVSSGAPRRQAYQAEWLFYCRASWCPHHTNNQTGDFFGWLQGQMLWGPEFKLGWSQDFTIFFPLGIKAQQLVARRPNNVWVYLRGLETRVVCFFQTFWGLESCVVSGDSKHNRVDTCYITLEHSVTWLVKKVGEKGGRREEAVLDPYGSQLKLIGKSF